MTELENRTSLLELSSGKFLDVMNPDPNNITLDAIAHALSLTCRFSGHCDSLWSVASHTILVSRRLHDLGESYTVQLAGLHHDDAEFAVTDLPRPIKPFVADFVMIENRVLDAVLKALGLEALPVHSSAVKGADDWALAQEAGELMPSRGKYWQLGYEWDGVDRDLGGEIPEQVRARWLRRHRYLTERIASEH